MNTLHNYRTLCSAATLLRAGKTCTECIDRRSVLPALQHGCYRDSHISTVPMAATVAIHRLLKTYSRHIDALVALTEFQKRLLVKGGLPAERIHVRPNVFPSDVHCVQWEDREEKAVYLGRISHEKGIETLIRAWTEWGSAAPLLEVIGDGPDLESMRVLASNSAGSRIRLLGRLATSEAYDRFRFAKLLIVPSICFEGFPLVLREAFAFGVPVAASRLGAFEELVSERKVGRTFEPGDVQDLLRTVVGLWADQAVLKGFAGASREEFEIRYTASTGMKLLLRIYERAIEHKARRRPIHL